MRTRDYFPLGIAVGNAFCNRTHETDLLIENIKSGKHTLIIATRRYGKSSLAIRALQLSKQPYVEIDFYMATNERMVESYILNSVVELIGKALGPIDKLITSIKKYVKNLTPKINIGTENFHLELQSNNEVDPASSVKEALLLIEKLLVEKDKQAVILMDEFQTVGAIAQGKGIEAAIRHVAQKTKNLTIIFSGSNRKLLQTMFEDENRPLYKLCWKIALKRISADHYIEHIQKAAKNAWKRALHQDIINEILSVTEMHPFYLNKLCDRIWSLYKDKMPTIKDIKRSWNDILDEDKSEAVKEISLLSAGQKNVLQQIAKDPASQLTSKDILIGMHMTGSSVMTALHGLEEKDMIEEENSHYQIINPVVKHYVLKVALG